MMTRPTVSRFIAMWWVCLFYHGVVAGAKETGAQRQDDQPLQPHARVDWRPRESRRTTSSVMIADNRATLWIYAPSHVKEDDPVNTILKYSRPNNNSNKNHNHTPTLSYWKYEFSCQSLPSVALAHEHGDIWALGCPTQQVPLYNGQQLTSQSGAVTLFQWLPHKQRARIVQTIYGKNNTDQLGQFLSMSQDGRTIALVATTKLKRSKNKDNNDYLEVYHWQNETTASSTTTDGVKQKWMPLGDSFPCVTSAVLSSDGTIVATMNAAKVVQIFSWSVDHEEWTEEAIQTARGQQRQPRGLSISSLSLSGNGQVLSLLQPARVVGGQAIQIYRRTRTTVHNNNHRRDYEWKLDSSIPPQPETQTQMNQDSNSNNKNQRHSRNKQSSFGWTASLSGDGNRIAIAEPSARDATGIVWVYDYCGRRNSNTNNNNNNNNNMNSENEWIPVGNPIRGKKPLDSLGRYLHLSNDGTMLIVKAVAYSTIYELLTVSTSDDEGYHEAYNRQSACNEHYTVARRRQQHTQLHPTSRHANHDEL